MDKLPNELIFKISSYFDDITQFNLFLTCKSLAPLLEKKADNFHDAMVKKLCRNQVNIDWKSVSIHAKITNDFLFYLHQKVDLKHILEVRLKNNTKDLRDDVLKKLNLQKTLSNNEINKQIDILDWNLLAKQRKFSNKLVKIASTCKFIEIPYLLQHQKLNLKMIEYLYDNNEITNENWVQLVESQHLSDKFLKKVISRSKIIIDWEYLIQKQKLSPEFIQKYHLNMNPMLIAYYQDLSGNEYAPIVKQLINENNQQRTMIIKKQKLNSGNIRYIIDKYGDESNNLFNIAIHQKLSTDIILYLLKIVPSSFLEFWNLMIQYQKINSIILKKMIKLKIKISWCLFYKHQKISDLYLRELIKNDNTPLWGLISKHQNLEEGFIDEYADKLNWELLCRHQSLSEQLMERFKNEKFKNEHWYYITVYQKINEDFALRNYDKLNWDIIWDHQVFPNLVFYKETDLKILSE